MQVSLDVISGFNERVVTLTVFLFGKGLHRVDNDRDEQVEHGEGRDQDEDNKERSKVE